MKLIIAEKPSVGRSIAAIVGASNSKDGYIEGNGYIVTWCLGHLVALVQPDSYDEKYKTWSFDTLPIMPDPFKFGIIPSCVKQYKIIKALMQDDRVDELICATDAGREGECIFRYVYNYIRCRKPFKRLWVSSMEDDAIHAAMQNLQDGHNYDRLYAAGFCRSKADWLVGMNATRLFTCRYKTMLSVGRVQTPVLAMIVQRDYDIQHFVKQKYYTVNLDCGSFTARSERIDDAAAADQLIRICTGKTAHAAGIKKEINTINPPKLYDLTTLQREANRQFGYTAQQTLDYTQALYEKKLVTYPRTDSQFLTDDMEQTARSMIDTIFSVFPAFGQLDFEPKVKRCINNKKVSDHHAVIPTAEISSADLNALPDGEKNILQLVAAKLVLATAAPHRYESTKVTVICENHPFTATGRIVVEDGWKALESKIRSSSAAQEEKDEPDEKKLPQICEGQTFDNVAAHKAEHWTSPPKPYTEDTLLSAMETAGNSDYNEDSDVDKKGLGTPATRANIIETLVKRGYIERQKKQMLSTDKGRNLIAVVPDEIKSAKLTADWETRLQQIEQGKESKTAFMQDITTFVQKLCSDYGSAAESNAFQQEKRESIGNCPKCGKEVKKGKFGFYCTGKCGMYLAKVFGKELTESQLTALLSGKETSFTNKGKKTIVLPEVVTNEKDGKTYYQWGTKRG